MCNGEGGAPGPCWQGGAEGPSVLEALSWRAWCGGGPGDGWAEVSLSKRFQISESLAEKREAVGEARPRAEWPGSVNFIGAAMRVFF